MVRLLQYMLMAIIWKYSSNINSPFEHHVLQPNDYVTEFVYRAIHKVMEDKARFEAIALGEMMSL